MKKKEERKKAKEKEKKADRNRGGGENGKVIENVESVVKIAESYPHSHLNNGVGE